ncbi:hypothetical protein PR001_g21922 [Phytophthora rubi]|nr:hypothetical protein PR001_g21922 [Phytophthora rubi]
MSIVDPKQENESAPLLPTTTNKVEAEPSHHALLGIGCVAVASVCFSFMSTFIKYMTFTFSSMEATFWRSIGVLVCNYVVVKLSGISLDVPQEYRKILLYRCIAGFSCMGFAFYAMSQMVLADASVLVLTSPVMTFFFSALFLHEKIDPVSLLCAIGAFGGLICVVRPGLIFGYDHPTAATDGSWIGVLSGLLGALSQVFVFLTMRQLKGLNVIVIVHYFALASVILTLLWLALIQQSFYIPSTFLLWRAIVGTGIFTFGGQMFLTRGFQLEKAGVASVMRYLDVVFVFIWDSTILGEHINHWSIVGAVIILTCAVVIALRKIQTTEMGEPYDEVCSSLAKKPLTPQTMSIGQEKSPSEAAPLLPTTAATKVEAGSSPHALLGIGCVTLASLCFGSMAVVIKYMTFTFSAMEATFWRSVGVLVCNSIVVMFSGTKLYVPPEYRRMLVYRCLTGFISMGFSFYAMSQMVLADASSLIFISPVLTMFFGAIFLHERIETVSLICALASFGGLVCVVRPGFLFGYDHPTASTDGSWIGVCSALLGALSRAFVFLSVRQLRGLNAIVIVHYFAVASVIMSGLWLALVEQSFYIPSTFVLWRAVIATGVFAFGGQMSLTIGFQVEKAGVAAVLRYMQVVFVFILDSNVLGEHINHWSVIGAMIILICAVVIAVRKIHSTIQS